MKLRKNLMDMGFKPSNSDVALLFYNNGTNIVIFLIFVDGIVMTGSNSQLVEDIVKKLSDTFTLKDLGDLSYFLGIEVCQFDIGFHLSKRKYIKKLLTNVELQETKPVTTPFPSRKTLCKHDGELFEDVNLYRTIIRPLQYCTLTS